MTAVIFAVRRCLPVAHPYSDHFQFTDGEIKTQRGQARCPMLHKENKNLNPDLSGSRVHTFFLYSTASQNRVLLW